MIGPLGVKMSFGNEADISAPIKPITGQSLQKLQIVLTFRLGSRLIGWLMKRFHDITSRNEAARFLVVLVRKALLTDHDGSGTEFHIPQSPSPDGKPTRFQSLRMSLELLGIPLEICSTCKQFTALLSFQAKVTLS